MAQKTSEENLFYLLIWDAVLEKTHWTLVKFVLLPSPKAIQVARSLATIAIIFLLAEAKIFGSFGTDAFIGCSELIPYICHIVLKVKGVFIAFREESFDM